MRVPLSFVSSLALWASASASGFPPAPEGISTVQVRNQPGVSISYKQTTICEHHARAWAGYVHMPSTSLADVQSSDLYNISMFFWYFEARHNAEHAPTAMYFAGGPGESSMFGAAEDGGPCVVLPDSNSTASNPWSWNEHVNMLYIDQPVGAGFSYDTLINSTWDMLFGGSTTLTDLPVTPFDTYNSSVPEANSTFYYGTFPSQDPTHTANNTVTAAMTIWHFTQAWFAGFPQYCTSNKQVSLWGNSYGGFWVVGFTSYIQKQNRKIEQGQLNGTIIPLDTAGMTNGCIDLLYQVDWYPDLAYNNTYNLQVIPEDVYVAAKEYFTQPGGCRDLIMQCRELGDAYDPDQLAINQTVNDACLLAELNCTENMINVYNDYTNRSVFDMAQQNPAPFPPPYAFGFFNQEHVLRDLGVPVNFSSDSWLINNLFVYTTGDDFRYAGMKDVEYILDQGIKIALIYGDRDYRCPWLGVEHLSLEANWTGADDFRSAGYADIKTNASYNGGVVRQHGNLSFSRVFEAGHDAVVYQPDTVYEIFNRAMFGKDVATGKLPTSGRFNNYSSSGPLSSLQIKNELPPPPPVLCYLYDAAGGCNEDQFEALANGTAEMKDFVIVKPVAVGFDPVVAGGQ